MIGKQSGNQTHIKNMLLNYLI